MTLEAPPSGAVRVSRWPAVLVDLVLVPLLPAATLFAAAIGWARGSFVGAVVIAAVFFIGRGTYSPARPAIVGTATAVYLALSLLGISLGTAFSCPQPTHPWVAFAAAGAVVLGLGSLSLWRRFLWGIPIAVLLGLVVFFAVYSKLPAIPMDCSD